MARKKNNLGSAMAAPSSGGDRMSTDISSAENGFIVNVSGESGGKNPSYFNKRFIAATRPDALRIAATHFKMKGGKKKGAKKKAASKRAL